STSSCATPLGGSRPSRPYRWISICHRVSIYPMWTLAVRGGGRSWCTAARRAAWGGWSGTPSRGAGAPFRRGTRPARVRVCRAAEVGVLAVGGAEAGGAAGCGARCLRAGLRVDESGSGSLGARIRAAAQRKVPYVVVIGAAEEAAGAVSLDRVVRPIDEAL